MKVAFGHLNSLSMLASSKSADLNLKKMCIVGFSGLQMLVLVFCRAVIQACSNVAYFLRTGLIELPQNQ